MIEPVREIIASAKRYSAADAYNGLYRLRLLKRQADRVWAEVDCILTPTAGITYTSTQCSTVLSASIRILATTAVFAFGLRVISCPSPKGDTLSQCAPCLFSLNLSGSGALSLSLNRDNKFVSSIQCVILFIARARQIRCRDLKRQLMAAETGFRISNTANNPEKH